MVHFREYKDPSGDGNNKKSNKNTGFHKDKDSDNMNVNKPDYFPYRQTQSQQAGLITGTATFTTNTSSPSSSPGSVSGPRSAPTIRLGQFLGWTSHSAESSPVGASFGGRSGSVGSGSVCGRSSSSGRPSSGGVSSRAGHARVGLPAANICPTGGNLKSGMMLEHLNPSRKTKVLNPGGMYYGYGTIMRGGVGAKVGDNGGHICSGEMVARSGGGLTVGGESRSTEEFKKLGNESHMKGNYTEALSYYDKGIATLHFDRASSLMGLKRLPQAVKECEEAIRLNPGYVRAHKRLGSLFLSLGEVENARRHLSFPGIQADPNEMQKLQIVEMHIRECSNARIIYDWRSVLRETDAAIASGADSSPQLFACRAEALLKLQRVDDSSLSLSDVPKFEVATASYSRSKFLGMLSEAYLLVVEAQIELARGRFDNAVTTVEKAAQLDPHNREVSALLRNVRLVARAWARGNDLFKSERFTEACSAYEEGLRLDASNSVLYCNRAACWYKLGLWENSLDDCNQALYLLPNYSKALLRRAASYSKLERWAEAVKDYEVLEKETPCDSEIVEQLFHARVALLKSRGENVSNMKFGGEVELVLGLEQFRAAMSSPTCSTPRRTMVSLSTN